MIFRFDRRAKVRPARHVRKRRDDSLIRRAKKGFAILAVLLLLISAIPVSALAGGSTDITAEVRQKRSVTVHPPIHGRVLVLAPLTVYDGDTVCFTVTPDDGYLLSAAICNGVNVTANMVGDTYTATVSGDIAFSVTFTAKPAADAGGKKPAVPVTVPVNGDGSSVKFEATVSGSTAAVGTIPDAELAKVADGGAVEIDLTDLKKNIDTVMLPTETVERIGEKNGMRVKLNTATVTFDKTATQEIASQANGSTIRLVVDDIKEVSLNAVQKEAVKKLDTALIIDAHLVSDGRKLCTEGEGGFGGGKATVALPFEIKTGRTAANYSVYYVDDAGNLEKLNTRYDAEMQCFVFDIAHFSNYVVAYDANAMPFTDVPAGEYYCDAVKWAAEHGITEGVGGTMFCPNAPVTRAQAVTFLWRAAGCPAVDSAMKMRDVKSGEYYTEAVRWALSEGITKGTGAATFTPDAACTRGQIVTFLARFAGVEDADTVSAFRDVKRTDYFAAAVKWAKDNGVTEGSSATTFSPNEACTRAQVVTFLYRWMVR